VAIKEKLKVMVVDDHVTSRMVTVEGLRTLGIANIAVSSGGREAFLAMVNSPVHLLITDLHMPDIDGFKLIYVVRNHSKIGKTAAIILTGKKDQAAVDGATKLGVNDVLSKPFSQPGLKSAIESIFGAID